jgi:hypothetical protein
VLLVLAVADRERYQRALVRWHARCCLELPVRADEAGLLLGALRALAGPARPAAAETLLELMELHGRRDEQRAIEEWLDRATDDANGDGAATSR